MDRYSQTGKNKGREDNRNDREASETLEEPEKYLAKRVKQKRRKRGLNQHKEDFLNHIGL
jgi:hypothetical protein